jgi:hypothetical protein
MQVDVHAKNGEDDTPLYMAVLCNNLKIVKRLGTSLQHPPDCKEARYNIWQFSATTSRL